MKSVDNKRPLKVFLCHAHADRDPVRGLHSRLTQDGVDAWFDKAKLLPGQDWEFEIRKAVREADVVVVCLSKQFNQAGFRQKEVRLALDTAMEKPEGEIFIIPARLEECDNLESLRKWYWVDLFEDDGYSNLIKSLNKRATKIKRVIVKLPSKEKKTRNSVKESLRNISLRIGGNVEESAIVIGSNNVVQIQSGKTRKISENEIQEARKKYLESLIRQTEYVDQRGKGLSRSMQLKLDEVNVSLTVERDIGRRDFDHMKEFRRDEDHLYLGREFDDSHRDSLKRPIEIVDLAYAVRENDRLIILGDPGSGKTILTRFLALHFASQFGVDRDVKDKENNIYGSPKFPILLRIAVYAEAFTQNRTLNLREFILNNVASKIGVPKDTIQAMFGQALDQGKALVLFDGLDEIVDESDRAEIGRRIEQFVVGHSGNRFIITSRIAGYYESPLTGNFAYFILREMERPQIEKFLRRWCHALEKSLALDMHQSEINERTNDEVDGILKSVDENLGVRRLASNPLMLTILVLIFREEKRLTSRRVELYRRAVNIILKNWQIARGVTKNTLKEYEIINVLAPLAYWMHENHPSGLAREHEIKREIAKALAKGFGKKPENFEVLERANDFFIRLIGTGMLVMFSEHHYGFMHLTFEEYFAAQNILTRNNETAKLIYDHRHSARWEEVVLLTIGFLSDGYPEDATELVRTAVLAQGDESKKRGFEPSVNEEILHRDLLLAVRAIGDSVNLDPTFCRELIQALMQIYFDAYGSGRYVALEKRILVVLRSLRGSKIAENASEVSLLMLRNEEPRVRARAAAALGQLGLVNEKIVTGLLELLKDNFFHAIEKWYVQESAALALGELGQSDPRVILGLLDALNEFSPAPSFQGVLLALRQLGTNKKEMVSKALMMLKSNESDRGQDILIQFGATIEDVRPLLDDLDDENWEVRSNIVWMLGKLGDKNEFVVNSLLKSLRDENQYVRRGAGWALGQLGEKGSEAETCLLAALSDVDNLVSRRAAESLIKIGCTNELVEIYLLISLKDENEELQMQAVTLLGKLGDSSDDVVLGLLDVLEKKGIFHRVEAVKALGQVGRTSEVVINRLLEALKNDDAWQVREAAAAILGQLGQVSLPIVAGLFNGLKDHNSRVRVSVIDALLQLREINEITIINLLALLRDNDFGARLDAILTLSRLGEQRLLFTLDMRQKLCQTLAELLTDTWSNAAEPRSSGPFYNDIWQALWNITAVS